MPIPMTGKCYFFKIDKITQYLFSIFKLLTWLKHVSNVAAQLSGTLS